VLLNPVTLPEMKDGIVDSGEYSRYCNEIMHFLAWIHENEASWFTDYGQA
jgi:hypothetical protein